jgi:hypothetical protein
MDRNKRAELLKDEYVMLQKFYEEIDSKGLNIKNWAISVAIAAIGTGILYHKGILLIAFFVSLVFWYLEAYWRGLSHFFAVRIQEIEDAFRKGTWEKETPLQVYSTWSKEYKKAGDQTFEYLFKQSSLLPHLVIALISLLIYFIWGDRLPG